MNRVGAAAIAAALTASSAPAQSPKPFDPVAFFTGATQGRGELRELLGKAKKTSTQSVGRVDKDGWLLLDQKVAVEGDPVRQRRWRLKQVAPGKYSGTLSDAKGPVKAEVRGPTVRIRYVMKGNIKVDQELTAVPGGRAVINRGTFRKFGMKVAIMKERIDKR
ncbi:MAG: DUF3833 domain-containing protein [Pseudomonadota bacterium]|nr:DUF3833 domain-containing protein [Pseudomonadota bacterium]